MSPGLTEIGRAEPPRARMKQQPKSTCPRGARRPARFGDHEANVFGAPARE